MSRLIDADALMEASKYEFWQDCSAITPIGEYILGKFRRLIRNMPTVTPEPRWIPVSERLPKIGIDVLFTVKVNGCKWVAEGCYRVDGRWWHYFMNRALEYDKVTAWMPLPEPYRGEGEQDG